MQTAALDWSSLESARVLRALDGIAELEGAGLALVSACDCRVLRDSHHASGLQTFLALYAFETRELEDGAAAEATSRRILSQLSKLGLSCGSAGLVGNISIAGATRAATIAERALPVGYMSAHAFLATDARGARMWAGPLDGGDVDAEAWYRAAATALEAIARLELAPRTETLVHSVLEVRSVTGRSFDDVLRHMTRSEKQRLTQEIRRLEAPGVSRKKLNASLRLGAHAKLYRNHALLPWLRRELLGRLSAVLDLDSGPLARRIHSVGVYLYQEE